MKIVDTTTGREVVTFLVFPDEALYLQGPRCIERSRNCADDCTHLESLHVEDDGVRYCLVCDMNADLERAGVKR